MFQPFFGHQSNYLSRSSSPPPHHKDRDLGRSGTPRSHRHVRGCSRSGTPLPRRQVRDQHPTPLPVIFKCKGTLTFSRLRSKYLYLVCYMYPYIQNKIIHYGRLFHKDHVEKSQVFWPILSTHGTHTLDAFCFAVALTKSITLFFSSAARHRALFWTGI